MFEDVLSKRQCISTGDASEYMPKMSTVGKPTDETLLVSCVTTCSDMETADVLSAKRFDGESLPQLFEAMSQLNPNMKSPEELKHRESYRRCMVECSNAHGNPIEHLVRDKVFDRTTGTLDWTNGSYRIAVDGGFIQTVTFRNGDVIDVSSRQINDTFQVAFNWSDWRAALVCKPFPPMKLHLIFKGKDGTGPYKGPKVITPSSEFFLNIVANVHGGVTGERQKASGEQANATLASDLKQITNDSKKVAMQAAKEKAAQKLSEEKSRSVINLNLKKK